jgi:SulP family sulfate permease
MLITFVGTLVMPLQYAVFLGVALAFLLYVIQQSNRVRLVQWSPQDDGWPLEEPPPDELPSYEATILVPYGSLFFAAASAFEDQLPKASQSRGAVVILGLRGRRDMGSTVGEVLERYAGTLRQAGGKLVLAGVHESLRDQMARTGLLRVLGRENVYVATPRFGESMGEAYDRAREWVARARAEDDQIIWPQPEVDAGDTDQAADNPMAI